MDGTNLRHLTAPVDPGLGAGILCCEREEHNETGRDD